MEDRKSFYRRFLTLASVIVLQNVVTLSVNLADNMMLGAYSEISLSGVAAVNQIQFVYQMMTSAFGDGLTVISTQYWGKKQTEPMRKLSGMAMRAAIALSVILFVVISLFPSQAVGLFTTDKAIIAEGARYLSVIRFTYLFFAMTQLMLASMRSVEKVNIAFYLSVLAFCVNCSINYVLIYGHFGAPRMGVVGAAIGTLAARIIEFTVVAFYVLKSDKRLSLKLRDYLTFDHTYLRDYVKITTPVMLSSAIWGVNTAMQTVILGHMTSSAIAANSVSSTLFLMVKSMAIGAATATAVIIGKAVGEGDEKKIRQYAKWLQQSFLVIGLISGIVLFLIRIPILSVYKLSPETKEMANSFLIILSVIVMFMSYQMPTNFGLIKGGGDTKYTTRVDFYSIFFLVLPSALIAAFVLKTSPQIVVICLNCDQFAKCVPAYIKCNHGHWIKKLTRDV